VNFDDLKKRATLPTRVVSLCLAGELVERIAGLERQLAEIKPATSLEGTPRQAILEEIVATQDEMRESTVEFKLRALGARAWARFWATWPVREEGETDQAWDERIFPTYLETIARSCVDPGRSPEQGEELATDLLHYRAFDQLVRECVALNRADVDIPNFDAASDMTGTSEQT
jgi:hypothetical protein